MRAFATTLCFAFVVGAAIPASAQLLTSGQERNAGDQSASTTPAPVQRTMTTLSLPAQQKKRPRGLMPLYVSYAALQMSDAATTVKALGIGAHEANGFMGSITKHPVPFFSLKAAVAGLGILGAERIWRKGGRKSALVVMLAGNALMGVVVNHNLKVIHTLSR